MATITNQTFHEQHIDLARNEYERCTFTKCVFVYAGDGPIGIRHSSIGTDCRFDFVGPAANTLVALHGIWSMGEWGRGQVRGTFGKILPEFGMPVH